MLVFIYEAGISNNDVPRKNSTEATCQTLTIIALVNFAWLPHTHDIGIRDVQRLSLVYRLEVLFLGTCCVFMRLRPSTLSKQTQRIHLKDWLFSKWTNPHHHVWNRRPSVNIRNDGELKLIVAMASCHDWHQCLSVPVLNEIKWHQLEHLGRDMSRCRKDRSLLGPLLNGTGWHWLGHYKTMLYCRKAPCPASFGWLRILRHVVGNLWLRLHLLSWADFQQLTVPLLENRCNLYAIIFCFAVNALPTQSHRPS